MTSEQNQHINTEQRKKLSRSDAVVGDDDNKFRTSTGKLSSFYKRSSTASQSRDSSYTDSTGTDLIEFISSTLHKNEKDRNFLLDMEQKMKDFVDNENETFRKFEEMSSYDRMMVHRVAAFFGLDHNIDQTGKRIVITKNKQTRKPDIDFNSLIRDNKFYDKAQFVRRNVHHSFDEARLTNYPIGGLVGFRPRMSTESPVGPGPIAAAGGVRRAQSFEVGDWHASSFGPSTVFMQSIAPSNTSSSGGSSYQIAAFAPSQFGGQPSPGYASFAPFQSPSIGSEMTLTSADITSSSQGHVSPIPEGSMVSPVESGTGMPPQTPLYIWPYYGAHHQPYYSPVPNMGYSAVAGPNCNVFQPGVPTAPISYMDPTYSCGQPGSLYISPAANTGAMFYPTGGQLNHDHSSVPSSIYPAINNTNQKQFQPDSRQLDPDNISHLASQLSYQLNFATVPQTSYNTASLGNVNQLVPQMPGAPQFRLRRAYSSPGKHDYYRRENFRRFAPGTDVTRRKQPRNRHTTEVPVHNRANAKDSSDLPKPNLQAHPHADK